MYRSTKTYNPGFSCAFRQWRAKDSHCSFIHGYALSFKFTFEAETLDERNWVVDFGGLDELKDILRHWFDHTTVIAFDDPFYRQFLELHESGLIQLRGLPQVGCEAFARHAFELADHCLKRRYKHARVICVEVFEHGANSAVYSEEGTKCDER